MVEDECHDTDTTPNERKNRTVKTAEVQDDATIICNN